MRRTLTNLVILSSIAAAGALSGGKAMADESATIRNESNHVVCMVLKWTNLPNDSGPIYLAPGQNYTTRGADGTSLFIRFNATPGDAQFPKWVDLKVITQFTPGPVGPGVFSVFRNINPFEVALVLP